jgi:uncharacterized lipoprotein NlpE involved in copper resistance
MKNTINLSLAILTVVFLALGCSDSGETAVTGSNANTTVAAPDKSSGKTKIKASTPAEADQSLFNAIKNKDKEAVKQLTSKKSLEMLEAEGKKRDMTIDDVLDRQLFANVTLPDKLQQRNEKIDGDKGTIESFSDTGQWIENKYVKEDGIWKADFFNR